MGGRKGDDFCFACILFGWYAGWALLIFGGIVGGLPTFGLPHPSPTLEKVATYLMAFSLLLFAASYLMQRFLSSRLDA
jgi:hypothetical protein